MTKPNITEIVFVVDRSGSMAAIAEEMKVGFSNLIDEQKAIAGECRVTLVTFDNEYRVVYSAMDIHQIPELKLDPRGMTALLDALGRTVLETGSRYAKMAEEDRPSQVLFVVITDGQENASKEFTRQRVFDMIKHQRDVYSWDFVFLGANQDAIATAQSLGIDAGNAVTYQADSSGTTSLMNGLSRAIGSYRTTGPTRSGQIYGQETYQDVFDRSSTDKK